MSRTTNKQELWTSAIQENSGISFTSKLHDRANLISAENNRLSVKAGYKLAIIDDSENVVKKGITVEKEVFNAMTKQVIKTFCERFKGFTDADFDK